MSPSMGSMGRDAGRMRMADRPRRHERAAPKRESPLLRHRASVAAAWTIRCREVLIAARLRRCCRADPASRPCACRTSSSDGVLRRRGFGGIEADGLNCPLALARVLRLTTSGAYASCSAEDWPGSVAPMCWTALIRPRQADCRRSPWGARRRRNLPIGPAPTTGSDDLAGRSTWLEPSLHDRRPLVPWRSSMRRPRRLRE